MFIAFQIVIMFLSPRALTTVSATKAHIFAHILLDFRHTKNILRLVLDTL